MTAQTVSTDIDVANLALDIIKEAPISSFDDKGKAPRAAGRNFIPARNMVLATSRWKFTIKRVELPEDGETPAFGWKRRFRVPEDCIRVLPLTYQGKKDHPLIPFEREGDFILTDAPAPIKVRYITAVDNVAKWPPLFVEAVAAKLAARIAGRISGKSSFVTLANDMYADIVRQAKFVDAVEGDHDEQIAQAYDSVRHANYEGGYI